MQGWEISIGVREAVWGTTKKYVILIFLWNIIANKGLGGGGILEKLGHPGSGFGKTEGGGVLWGPGGQYLEPQKIETEAQWELIGVWTWVVHYWLERDRGGTLLAGEQTSRRLCDAATATHYELRVILHISQLPQ